MSHFFPAYSNGIPLIGSGPILTTGKVYFVSSVHEARADAQGNGTYEAPFASIDFAVGQCTDNNDDVIVAMEGHIESITAAAGLVFDVAGVSVYFLGRGSKRATIKFGSAVGADMNVTAVNVTLYGPRFLADIDALTNPIHVSAADFSIKAFDGFAEWYDAAGKGTTHAIVATSAADRLCIDGYRYHVSTTGTQKHSHIQMAGGDHVVLRNIDIAGDFNVAPIEGTAAITNILLENINVNNTNVGPLPGLNLHANTTGFAKNVKSRVASGTTYVTSVAKIQWAADCEGFSTDGYGGDPIGTELATSIEGKLDTVDGYFDVPTANATANVTVRDVVGNKTDAAVQAIAADKSVVGYLKGLVDAVAGTAGLATWPTPGVAPGNGVSISEVLRYIVENVHGTYVNTGGADAKLATIFGDFANVTLVARLANIYAQLLRGTGTALPDNQSVYDLVAGANGIASWPAAAAPGNAVSLAAALGYINNKVTRTIYKNLAAAALTGTATQFTVSGGPILIRHLGVLVTTDIPAGANTLQFQFDVDGAGAAAALTNTTDTASAAANQLFICDGVKATALVKVTDPGIMVAANEHMPIMVSPGVIQTVFSAGPPASGAATVFMQWEPMTINSAVA